MYSETAAAKINLFLHIIGKRPNGYHCLQSLIVFADWGDVLHAYESDDLSFEMNGEFSDSLKNDTQENLVLKAARVLRETLNITQGAEIRLEKNLPVAAGIGGGSADAAAVLRLLPKLWGRTPGAGAMEKLALKIGADVPACYRQQSLYAEEIGEQLQPLSLSAPLYLVLVNPGVTVSTAEIFQQLSPPFSTKVELPDNFLSTAELIAWLKPQRNDLQEVACRIFPVISKVLATLTNQQSCMLARMSGSGATCFGIFVDQECAKHAEEQLRITQPTWWVRAVNIAGGSDV